MPRTSLLTAALVVATVTTASAVEFRVSNAAELTKITPQLQAGDVVIFADGTWKDQEVNIRGKGAESRPIEFRAATPGKAVISGQGSLDIDGEYLVVSGLALDHGEAAKEGIAIRGKHCRVTECSVVDSNYKFSARGFGATNRVDHCSFAGKTNDSPTMQVESLAEPNWHRIDHNHFGPRPPLGRNGGETIRVGYSHQSMNESRTTVESNLFERCDGELEIISNKSCDNVYRGNTFLECAGMFTLRHGNRSLVEGNVFLGNQKKGSGGIRIIGEDHVVVNNYIDGISQGAFWVTSGIPKSPLVGYFQTKNCIIAFNTVVNSKGACIDLAAGLGTSGRTLAPENITVANNVFAVMEGEQLVKGKDAGGYRWVGNVGSAHGLAAEQLRAVDLDLKQSEDGIWRPSTSSPCRGGAQPIATIQAWDCKGMTDPGCDQSSSQMRKLRPLTSAEVGPTWRSASNAAR